MPDMEKDPSALTAEDRIEKLERRVSKLESGGKPASQGDQAPHEQATPGRVSLHG